MGVAQLKAFVLLKIVFAFDDACVLTIGCDKDAPFVSAPDVIICEAPTRGSG